MFLSYDFLSESFRHKDILSSIVGLEGCYRFSSMSNYEALRDGVVKGGSMQSVSHTVLDMG